MIFKWLGIVLIGIVVLALVAAGGLLLYGNLQFKPTQADRPLYPITADTSPEGIARGEYLLSAVMACTEACHSEGGTPYAGAVENVNEGPISAVFAVPNLTPHEGTGLGSWSDAEIARAIREGYDKNGVKLAIMPSLQYSVLSDADVAAIVGYLRGLEPVENEIPPLEMNAVGKVFLALGMIGPVAEVAPIETPRQAPEPGSVQYGEYLASLGVCRDCHGPNLSGMPGQFGMLTAANLTPGGPLASWSEADFIQLMRTGSRPTGSQVAEDMPWKYYRGMTDEDLGALFSYLQSLPALEFNQ
jgi:mono/diheme cytochrome c family protein